MIEGERELVAWLRSSFGPATRRLVGDDAALLALRGDWALTTDSQIEGVHFPPGLPPQLLARRLLAVNLSDLAAVGARPALALLALASPPGWPLRPFFRGLRGALRAHRVVLAGGDLAASPTLTATLVLLGRRPPRGRWLRRDTARPGDRLWLGGTVGESAAGRSLLPSAGVVWRRGRPELPADPPLPRRLAPAARRAQRRHLLPVPQLALGQWLGRQPRAACIDLSDGLALDLHRLLEASAVGAELELSALPLSPRLPALAAALGADPEQLALAGGEDYVLLFTLPAGKAPPPRFGAVEVGRVVAGREVAVIGPAGKHPLPALGWDHLQPAISAAARTEPAS